MPEALGSNTSVYIGSFTKEYDRLLLQDPEVVLKHFATGTENSMLSNKLSWFYNLQGPSITLDTACSSSLNAVHLAYNGLKLGEASMVSSFLTFSVNAKQMFKGYCWWVQLILQPGYGDSLGRAWLSLT